MDAKVCATERGAREIKGQGTSIQGSILLTTWRWPEGSATMGVPVGPVGPDRRSVLTVGYDANITISLFN